MNKGYFLHVLVFIGFLIFIPVFHFSKATVANQAELNKLLEMVQIHDGILNEWQLLARQSLQRTISREELERIVAGWKKRFSQYTWTYTKNENTYIWHGKFYDENLQINERLQLIADLSTPTLQGFIVYEMKGNTLHRSTVQKIHEHYLHTLCKNPRTIHIHQGKMEANIYRSVSGNSPNCAIFAGRGSTPHSRRKLCRFNCQKSVFFP